MSGGSWEMNAWQSQALRLGKPPCYVTYKSNIPTTESCCKCLPDWMKLSIKLQQTFLPSLKTLVSSDCPRSPVIHIHNNLTSQSYQDKKGIVLLSLKMKMLDYCHTWHTSLVARNKLRGFWSNSSVCVGVSVTDRSTDTWTKLFLLHLLQVRRIKAHFITTQGGAAKLWRDLQDWYIWHKVYSEIHCITTETLRHIIVTNIMVR